MKLKLKEGREYKDYTVKTNKNTFTVIKDDKENTFNIDFISQNILKTEKDNKIEDLAYMLKGNKVFIYKNGLEYSFEFLDEKAIRRLSSSGGMNAGGPIVIKSSMPGKIVKILKSEGDEVKEGEAVVIMEAMKMENEMKAPYDGIIKEIFVKEGENIESNTKLFGME